MNKENNKIGLSGAIAVIAACMIGTGVFTSLGYQVIDIHSSFAIMALWAVGGIVALCGALCYAELAVRFPGSGGEYNFLSRIFHPAVGFLSGWISATIGFAAPIALSAMAFGKYFGQIVPIVPPPVSATIVIALATAINFAGLSLSEQVQKGTTYLNLGLIVLLIICGVSIAGNTDHFSFTMVATDWSAITTGAFAVSLVYVSYAFSGWNAITYVAGDVKNPSKVVPRSLLLSVILVALLYIMLNMVFLYRVPIEELAGKEEVGALAAEAIFGPIGGKLVAAMICLGLLASVLAMTIAGPRLTEKIGQDFPTLAILAKKNKKGAPYIAILLQTAIALTLAWSSTFDAVLRYVGFTLALFTTMTVIGLLWVRYVKKEPLEARLYRTPLFPIPAIIFIGLELWMLYYMLTDKPTESIGGLATVLLGLLVYFLANSKAAEPKL